MDYKKPTIKLSGEDGNVFAIMGRVVKALRKAGASKEETDKYIHEVVAGADYDKAIQITMEYVNVE